MATKAQLKRLRKKHKLGEFAPRTGKRRRSRARANVVGFKNIRPVRRKRAGTVSDRRHKFNKLPKKYKHPLLPW